MSEDQQSIKRTKPRTVTNLQFFQVCEEMRNRREQLTTECPKVVDTARMLTEWLKFEVSEKTVRRVQEATGITWEPKRKDTRKRSADATSKNAARTLVMALRLLYKKLGEEMPEALVKLCCFYDGSNVEAALQKNQQEVTKPVTEITVSNPTNNASQSTLPRQEVISQSVDTKGM